MKTKDTLPHPSVFVDAKRLIGELLDGIRDSVPVRGAAPDKNRQHEHVERMFR